MFYILGAVLIICGLIAYEKRKSDRATTNATERFWDREREANLTRRKDISNLPYINVPYDTLPLTAMPDSDEYNASVQQLQALSDKKILDLSGMTNTDLKLTYGAANLPVLMECDQNYLVLLRCLSRMANLLLEAGLEPEAETVLAYSLHIGSTIRSSYEQLASIYCHRKDYRKLDALIARAEALETSTKDALLSSLYTIRQQASGTKNTVFNPEELFESETPSQNDHL